jgi:hypothetical protein
MSIRREAGSSPYRETVEGFLDSGVERHTLGLVYGRRRIGKSTLLDQVATDRRGFYWEATRTESAVQLARLGTALGEHLGVGRLALTDWEEALRQLLRLGSDAAIPVVLDEFGHVLEATPGVDSVVASALGPAAQRARAGRARLILCGSAIAMLSALTAGQAPLRGRAGMELVMQPHDFRDAATWLSSKDLALAIQVHAVIGGVIGYATDMVDHDLPTSLKDFPRWVAARVLAPSATLHHEATTLLAEDPTLAAGSPLLHHGILGGIANGSVNAGKIAKHLARSVPSIDPALRRLIAAGFVIRQADPIRAQRPMYSLADSFLQFHYAVLEPNAVLLRERDVRRAWDERLAATFQSRVLGPVFEEQSRAWVRRYATEATLGGPPDHVGPTAVTVDGVERQIDVVVAIGSDDAAPTDRTVTAIGEAKAGETAGTGILTELERARAALGHRATSAKLLLFAAAFTPELRKVAARRSDVELVDHERLYHGN